MPFIVPALAAIGTAFGGTAAVAATATTAAVAGTAVSTGVAVVGTAASLAGAGYGAYSQYQAGKTGQALNDYNAALMQQQANTTERDAAIEANARRVQSAHILASQRAGFAASGAVVDVGSPLLVEASQAGYLELDTLNNQRRQNIQAGQYRQQAGLDTMQGAISRRTGNLNAGATILQGVGRAAGGYAGLS